MAKEQLNTDYEDFKVCEVCNSEMEWVNCPTCGGEGIVEDDDPDLYLNEPNIEACHLCDGEGGWLECINVTKHNK